MGPTVAAGRPEFNAADVQNVYEMRRADLAHRPAPRDGPRAPLRSDGLRAEIRASEPIGRRRRPREDRPPVVDALSVAAFKLGSFVGRELGGNQQVEEVAIEVGRLPEELGVGQDEVTESAAISGSVHDSPTM